jgi:sugar phosphate isomerase/epimerase
MNITKFISSMALALMLSGCCSMCCDCSCSNVDQPNISVFAHFIRNTAKQQNITLVEAANKLYDLGVRGFDIGPDDKDLAELASSKLKPVNFYFFPKMYGPDNGAADCKRCLDQAVKYGVPRVMVVPTHFTGKGDEEAEFAKTMSSMKMFVSEAKKRGITITVEDFGGTRNAGSHIKYLKRYLDEIPDIKFALDSGNLYYAGRGEDILYMMEYAKDRIGHVHLKDQLHDNNRKYATLGLGAVPNETIVKTVAKRGYDGWYTLENTVGDAYTDSIRQVAVLKYWLKEAKKK